MSLDSNFNIFGTGQVGPIDDSEYTGETHSTKKVDTLSRADQEALATMMLAGYPLLPPPKNVEYSSEADMKLMVLQNEAKMQQIAKQMLDSWAEAIARENKIVNEYLQSDAFRKWLEVFTPKGQDSVERTTSSVLATNAFIEWSEKKEKIGNVDPLLSNLSSYLMQVRENNETAVASLPFVMVNFTAPGALSDASSPYLRDLLVSANLPIQPSVRSDLGMVGAIFSAGALNYAEAANTANAISGKKPHNDNNLALNYGARIISLVTDPNFDSFLSAMFGRKGSKEQIDERINIFKMVLASTALMAIYHSEAKYLSRGDFEGMIRGTTKPRSEVEAGLVAIFNIIKDSGKVSANVYNRMVAGLGDYADKNPNFSSFFKVDNAFIAIAERLAETGRANASIPTNSPI